jgi:hypothetical protein
MTKKKNPKKERPYAKFGGAFEYYATHKKAREEAVARFFKRIERQNKEEIYHLHPFGY